jgi:hypothetical protein
VCFNPIAVGQFDQATVFDMTKHFGNPLNASIAYNSGFFETSELIFVSRVIGDSMQPGEILTLEPTSNCQLRPLHSTYVNPSPIALSIDGSFVNSDEALYWQLQGDATTTTSAALFRWDVQKKKATNVSLTLSNGSKWSAMGLAQPTHDYYSYGLLADQVPGASHFNMRLVYLDPLVEFYNRTFAGISPTSWMTLIYPYDIIIMSRLDTNGYVHFSIVRTSPPTFPPQRVAQKERHVVEQKERHRVDDDRRPSSNHTRLQACPRKQPKQLFFFFFVSQVTDLLFV